MPSQKILEAKQKVVAGLVSDYRSAKTFIFADARGLTVLEDTQMRADLRKNNITYKVLKNTTATLVFKELGISGVDDVFKGPTAIAYSSEDLIAPAKVMKQYADKYAKLSLKGGVIEGKAASIKEVNDLASIPSKEVLCGQIAYGLLFPFTKLAMLVKAVAEKLDDSAPKAAVEKTEEPAAEVEAVAPATEEKVAEVVEEKVTEAATAVADVAATVTEEAAE